MRSTAALFIGVLLLSAPAVADVFRCHGPDGTRFSDTACGQDAERIVVEDNRIGGRFDTNLPPPNKKEPETEQDQAATARPPAIRPPDDPCRYIPSTDLRRYVIREQVVKGMTKENVIDAFGRPPETYPVPQETWVYTTDYYGLQYELTYVYFRDGCVENVVYRKP
ncbi:outer membrane protein assembly factor BamE [Marinobacter fonticola]|uniref:outer membrane protein assembly factor BamE n=1 Tax=Marinobacter fonticola TaxID=2603215 RepID=UPI0011E6244B|nr:outer membrane protein assembly factor BamE [Marinobacter fonticola]